MRFELDDDQGLLRSSTREFLENEAALADTRVIMEETAEGFAKDMYAQLGDLGYRRVLLSDEDGGRGPLRTVHGELGPLHLPELGLSPLVVAGVVCPHWDPCRFLLGRPR